MKLLFDQNLSYIISLFDRLVIFFLIQVMLKITTFQKKMIHLFGNSRSKMATRL